MQRIHHPCCVLCRHRSLQEEPQQTREHGELTLLIVRFFRQLYLFNTAKSGSVGEATFFKAGTVTFFPSNRDALNVSSPFQIFFSVKVNTAPPLFSLQRQRDEPEWFWLVSAYTQNFSGPSWKWYTEKTAKRRDFKSPDHWTGCVGIDSSVFLEVQQWPGGRMALIHLFIFSIVHITAHMTWTLPVCPAVGSSKDLEQWCQLRGQAVLGTSAELEYWVPSHLERGLRLV